MAQFSTRQPIPSSARGNASHLYRIQLPILDTNGVTDGNHGSPKGGFSVAQRVAWVIVIAALLSAHPGEAAEPRAQAGVFDLSHWDEEQAGPVKLAGEWEFYWGELLEPVDFRSPQPPEPTGLIALPGGWNGYRVGEETLGADGFATYRLRIRLPGHLVAAVPGSADLALHLPWSFSAYRLWLNGELVAANGVVGRRPQEMVPEFLPLTVPFESPTEMVEIVVQVSNFVHRNGGLWNAPLFGTYGAIARREMVREAIDTALIGAVLFMALYHLTLYVLIKARIASLYLGLTAAIAALRTMVTSEHVLGRLAGGLPWGLEIRIEYMMGYVFLLTFLQCLSALFPQDTSRHTVRAGGLIALAGIAVTLVTPVRFSSQLIPYYMLAFTPFVLYGAWVFVTAALRNRDGARIILVGGLALIGSLLHDLFHYNLSGLDIDLFPLGLFLFLFFQSLTVAQRFSLTLRREAALALENAALLNTVREQLEEVKRSHRLLARQDEELRHKIAERLHGSTQNRLLHAWHQLAAAKEAYREDGARGTALVEEVQAEIDYIREVEIRQVSHLLHPSIVGVGVIPAVESLANQYGGALRIRVDADETVQAWDDPRGNRIPEPVRLVLYRVLEEALGNTLAHAHASAVEISLTSADGNRLTMTVRDDGRGFDPRVVERRLGLRTIAARVGSVDGEWEITSRPGHGTAITLVLPLDGKEGNSPPAEQIL